MVLERPRRLDFLRHIVNRILAELGASRQLVDDIRRMVGGAEDKYKFNAFGGNVERLADYLRSRDFDDLVTLVRADRSGQGIELLKRILEEAKKAYSDVPGVVEAIEARLSELESHETSKTKNKAATLYTVLKDLEKLKAKVEFDEERNEVQVAALDGKFTATVSYDEKSNAFTLVYRAEGTVELSSPSEVQEYLKKMLSTLQGK